MRKIFIHLLCAHIENRYNEKKNSRSVRLCHHNINIKSIVACLTNKFLIIKCIMKHKRRATPTNTHTDTNTPSE